MAFRFWLFLPEYGAVFRDEPKLNPINKEKKCF